MLDRLVAFHVAAAVADRALVAVWLQDGRSLPRPDEQRIRHRQVGYVAIWLTTLARVRPELAPARPKPSFTPPSGRSTPWPSTTPASPAEKLEALWRAPPWRSSAR